MFTFRVFETLCQTKINDVYVIGSRHSRSNQEIIRLDVTVDDTLFVYLLNP